MKRLILGLVTLFLQACAVYYEPASATEYEVRAEGTKFVPMVLRVDVGDTVTFLNMAGHTTQTIDEYTPKLPGTTPENWHIGWSSKLGETYTTKPFEYDGVYFVRCSPHWSMGMGVAIIVGKGNPTNLDDIGATHPKGSAKRLLKKVDKFLVNEVK